MFKVRRGVTNMKRIICILLSLVFLFSLAACGTEEKTVSLLPSDSSTGSSTDNSGAGPKTLVVYFSATGSTRAVAETIAQNLDADIFEITPAEPYTGDDLDWSDENSRVSAEHNDENKRDVPLTRYTIENWEDYGTVYIGYPIWWGVAAWPVNGFVKANDFSGKTVIPFCTSASSGLGSSGKLLANEAGTGNWSDGKRFSSNVSEEEVTDWLNEQ